MKHSLALALLLAVGALAPAQEGKPLLWAADEEGGAPYIFPDPEHDGKMKGFEVDLAALLAKELGQEIEFKHYEFDSLSNGLERKDFDFIMNGWEVLPERLQKYRFSRPYYVYRLQLVMRRDDQRFGSLSELSGRKEVVVGTLAGTAAESRLKKLKVPTKSYSGQTELYRELLVGRLDAVYLDTVIQNQYLVQKEFKDRLRLVGPVESKGYYGIALRKEDGALADRFDAALRRLITDGRLRAVYKKWGIWNDDQTELSYFPWLRQDRVGRGTRRPSRGGRQRGLAVFEIHLAAAARCVEHGADHSGEHGRGGGPGAADRPGPAIRAGPGALAGDGLCGVLPGHPGAAAALLPLLRPGQPGELLRGGRKPGHELAAQAAPVDRGDPWLRPQLRGLRGGDLPGRHRRCPLRSMGGSRRPGHVALDDLPAHHSAAGDPGHPATDDQ
jgi:ABC-type amino acid transport substrate-binding protein